MMLRQLIALAIIVPLIACSSDGKNFRTRTSTVDLVTVEGLENDVKAEIEFGRELAATILGKTAYYDNNQANRYINLVGHAVARNSERSELDYYFAVIDTPEINAYATPGGYIFVTRGALELMEDEAELAAVLAHEIAHVTQRHIVKELNIKGKDEESGDGLTKLFGSFGDTARVAVNQALDKANQLLFISGLKKEDEYQADEVGTTLLITSGYDHTALHRYLSRVKLQKRQKTGVLHNTHPSFDSRLTELEGFYEEEQLSRLQAPSLSSRFNQYIRIQ